MKQQLEKNKDKLDKNSEKDLINSPTMPITRNYTSLGRNEKNKNNVSPSLEDGELIKRSRNKAKKSSKNLNNNNIGVSNTFNDVYIYDQRIKTKKNRIESSNEGK
jgi:hypothetical protein